MNEADQCMSGYRDPSTPLMAAPHHPAELSDAERQLGLKRAIAATMAGTQPLSRPGDLPLADATTEALTAWADSVVAESASGSADGGDRHVRRAARSRLHASGARPV